MILFLTSSPTGNLDGSYRVNGLDNRNGFLGMVRARWPEHARCLMITAFPTEHAASEDMTAFFENALKESNLSADCMELWDDRKENPTAEELQSFDVIFLGGGHVPTQNAFFHKLGLREKLENYPGMVIGISAGSMNSADEVYAQPEEPGEAADPAYQRFIRGLGLTKLCVLPHLQMVRNEIKDNGLRLFEDISIPDSVGHRFIALPDGSYILCEGGISTVYGEAWELRDGEMRQLTSYGESTVLIG